MPPRKRTSTPQHDATGVGGIKARTAAVQELIRRHHDEYQALYAEARAALGLAPLTREDITDDELQAVYAMRRAAVVPPSTEPPAQ